MLLVLQTTRLIQMSMSLHHVRRILPPHQSKVPNLHSFTAVFDVTEGNLPEVDPMEIIGRASFIPRYIEGLVHCAEVMWRVDMVDGETEQYLVRLGDSTQIDIMTYNAIVYGIENLLTRESEHPEDNRLWIFKKLLDHRKNGQQWNVLMKWEDGSESWEPLSIIWRSYPLTLAEYAIDNNLLHLDGWNCLWRYARNMKKLARLMIQVKLNSMNNALRIKFGFRIPRNHVEAMEFGSKNRNTK